LRERFGREELARHTVEDVIEAILIDLHDHLPRPSVDRKICQDHLLYRIEVPRIARYGLEMPAQFTRLGLHRQNRSDVEILFAFRLS
jgi:hypothetical protein